MVMSRFLAPAGAALLVHAAAAFAQSGPGSTFRDCAECPEMVVVPSGSFVMGAAPGEEEREELESGRGRSQPQTAVTIGSFALGRYEVTHRQFAAFVSETGYAMDGGCYIIDVVKQDWEVAPDVNWKKPGFPHFVLDDDPVVCVSWNDAQAYVAWLSRKTGKAYRLPSDAEWEYAARAGAQTTRPWGDSAADACAHANIWDRFAAQTKHEGAISHPCTEARAFVYTAPVGQFAANRFGLHDMIGNVWEWVQDCWNRTLAGMPANGAARLSGDCSQRILRGGSWRDSPRRARSAFRDVASGGFRGYTAGFRAARNP